MEGYELESRKPALCLRLELEPGLRGTGLTGSTRQRSRSGTVG